MRKSFFIAAFLIASALGALLLLAFHQFQLYAKHEQIISQAEKLTFQYASIREEIIEDIVQGRLQELAQVSSAVEGLQQSIVKLLDSPLIPAEYKFSFMQQIDLPGLVLLLRRTAAEQDDRNLLRLINENARIIGERFMLLERLVLGYAKQKLVDFQAVVIGILALVVFLVTFLLALTYRYLILPVLSLSAQAEGVVQGNLDQILRPRGWQEVAGLADRINHLVHAAAGSREAVARLDRVGRCILLVAGRIRESQDKKELCQAVCRTLLSNPDYILAWIGIDEGEGGGITPFAADGSSTMTGKECQECFGALLAAQEGKNDPSLLALRTGETVIRRDILAGAPKGPFKNTPMASGMVDSISLPIGTDKETFGVLTVYVMARDGMLELEAKALAELAGLLAARLGFFGILQKLEQTRKIKNCIGEQVDVITLELDREGTVRGVDSFLSSSPHRKSMESWLGTKIADIVHPLNDPEKVLLQTALAEARHYDFHVELPGFGGIFSAILSPVDEFPAEEATLLLVLVPPKKNMLIQPENFQVAYSSAVGQFASTIAHEITDLSNGIINYAQMLSDEIGGGPDSEQRKQLARIIAGGEKVAAVVEPLLVEQGDVEYASDVTEVQKIVDEVFILAGYLLRNEGITLRCTVQPPTLRYRRQQMRLLLLTLLNSLRAILNRQYPHKDPGKELTLTILQVMEEKMEMIRISVTVPWAGAEDSEEIECPAVLWLNKELVRNLGGVLNVLPAGPEKMKIELLLSP